MYGCADFALFRQRVPTRFFFLLMPCGCPTWLPTMAMAMPVAMSIPVSPWLFQGNSRRLDGSTIGIQDADTLGMLITSPVHHEHVYTVLQGAAHLHQPTVYQQLRPGLG